ncbi:MAG: protein kinase [Verrucomicrobiaceae bacterium]|nr:protein kinase [Verrucomicrobiaceae bacterium]
MSVPDQTPPSPASDEPTPAGYQRTTGGKLQWQPPPVEKLQSMLSGYEVLALVGHGGMGAVYRARQTSLDRLVAVKILPPEAAQDDPTFAARFKNEARTLAKLNHSGIVHVHDFGETGDGQLYIVMEFVEGTDVHRMLADHGVLTPEYALPIAARVCDALHYAHTHGVIHRDIKPANIMLTTEGHVKVADFGLARHDDPSTSALTQTNISMGTPDYAAPEALVIGGTVDHRADLYALGVMLHHMLVGEVPRGAFDPPSKRNAALDPRIDAIVLRAMRQNPAERYQSAAEMRADLDAVISGPQPRPAADNAVPAQAQTRTASQPGSGKTAGAPVRATAPGPVKSAPVRPVKSAPVKPVKSAPVKPALKQTSGVPAAATGGGAHGEAAAAPASRSLAWIVPTGISAVVILGGAFFLRGQRQKEIAPDVAAAARETTAKSQDDATLPAGPIKIADAKSAKPPAPAVATDGADFTSAVVAGCWTRGNKESHMLLLADGGVRLLRNGREDLRQDGTPWWKNWRWKFDAGVVHLHDDEGREVETLSLTAPDKGTLVRPSKDERFASTRVPLAVPGFWCPVRFPADKPPKGRWKDGVLTLPRRESCALPAACAARDAAIRARVTNTSGDGSFKGIYFKLRNDNALGFFDLGQSDIVSVGAQPDFKKDLITLAHSARGVVPLGRKDLLVEFAAIGDDLILALEGKVVASAKTNAAGKVPAATGSRANAPFLASIMSGWGEAFFRDLEFMPLDGISADRQPGFIKRAREAGVLAAAPVGVPASAGQSMAPELSQASAPAKSSTSPSLPLSPSSPKLPVELAALQSQYAAAIAEQVTTPHDASMKQLNAGFTAALDRAVNARQMPAGADTADRKAVEGRTALPPDTDTTPDALKTLRATYRTKAAEYDDARTTAHLGLLTPYVAKLKQLEADLTKAGRVPDAETVKSYRESLSENPFALPGVKR